MPHAFSRVTVVIASYLEPEFVERIRAVDERVDVVYAPELLPAPRYPGDHNGRPFAQTPEQQARWRGILGRADILFDFDRVTGADLPEAAPKVRWIQATKAGIGQDVKRHDYARRMPGTIFTTARGVHAQPLAEFCALAMLAFSRGLFTMTEGQRRRHWERFAGTDLEGRTALVLGAGSIGAEVARFARVFGMRVVGIKRTVDGADASAKSFDELHGPAALRAMLPRADFLILAAPHTPETERIIGRTELALLPRGAVLVNVGRGALVDEAALVEALRSGHLGGAALDVFEQEPLPGDSPLWMMPNVLVSPHTASISDRENARITDLFCENLRRFLAHEPMLNVFDTGRLY
ncbi:MAG: D-2-hydroxyacid dehydrogenase [Pseudomonadota bacterium]